MTLDPEERLEDLPYRLPEAFGGVLHSRRLQREAAIPGGRATHAPVVQAVDDPHRQQHDTDDHRHDDERAVARAVVADGGEQQPVVGDRVRLRFSSEQQRVHRFDQRNHVHRQNASRDADRRPARGARQRSKRPCVLGVRELRFPRAAEEHDAEEL